MLETLALGDLMELQEAQDNRDLEVEMELSELLELRVLLEQPDPSDQMARLGSRVWLELAVVLEHLVVLVLLDLLATPDYLDPSERLDLTDPKAQ